MSDALIRQAREDYGGLIMKITAWPPGLGIDVHLIGGEIVQYYPGGQTYLVEQPSAWMKASRRLAAARGAVLRLLSARN